MSLERHYPEHVTMRIKIKRALWNVTAAVLFRPFITKLFRLCLGKDMGAVEPAHGTPLMPRT